MPTTYGGGAMGGSPSYPEGTGPEEEEGEAEKQPSLEIVRDHSSNKIVLLRCALFLGFLGIYSWSCRDFSHARVSCTIKDYCPSIAPLSRHGAFFLDFFVFFCYYESVEK